MAQLVSLGNHDGRYLPPSNGPSTSCLDRCISHGSKLSWLPTHRGGGVGRLLSSVSLAWLTVDNDSTRYNLVIAASVANSGIAISVVGWRRKVRIDCVGKLNQVHQNVRKTTRTYTGSTSELRE